MHQSIGKKNKVIIYLILLFILSTTSGKFAVSQNNYSSINTKINIEGLSSIENLKISNELSNLFYKDILFIDKKEINKIMNKYNIIEEYNIKKIYPSTINIKVRPTKFLAKVSSGRQPIVGSNGKLIYSESNDEILPYIFGEFNSKEFLKFKKKIELSNLNFNEFKTVYFFPSNRWDVLTIDNILIKLPKHNILESLNLAHKIITNDQFKDKNVIDLRIKKHLIIK